MVDQAEKKVSQFYNTVGWKTENEVTEDVKRWEDLREHAQEYVRKCRLRVLRHIPAKVTNLSHLDDSVESLSYLHTMEHIGLGRYGDPIDPLGYLKGMNELQRVLKPGGKLYLSVLIGQERVEFNAY